MATFPIGILDVVVNQAEVVAQLHGCRSWQRGVVVALDRGVGEQPEEGAHPLSGRAAAVQAEVVAHHLVQAGRWTVADGEQAQDFLLGFGDQFRQIGVVLHGRIITTPLSGTEPSRRAISPTSMFGTDRLGREHDSRPVPATEFGCRCCLSPE